MFEQLLDPNLACLNMFVYSFGRAGDKYSSYYEISVYQHDVLRDLAIHLSNVGSVNQRRRLLMPRREPGLPKEWERRIDEPFSAQVISIHTGLTNSNPFVNWSGALNNTIATVFFEDRVF